MTGKPRIPALVGCQVEACAEEVSYPLDMVRRWQDRPICEQCYDDGARPADAPAWADLPSIDLSDLRE